MVSNETHRMKVRLSRVDSSSDEGGWAELTIDDWTMNGRRTIRLKLSYEELGRFITGRDIAVDVTERVSMKE